ncbi:DUF421 domain-containing protein [Intestinibacillus massiliensis]|uniref:DUF421 domain-containing protein n=1 Tax=Intestinibacillus massiliensis TaxID=1871029 RepID=UPI000B3546F0|nr:DUF421 domain-containing protein [Intestinibacillus massiliensis]MCB6364826.1 DUF421 domain-containing protein [Intestinibacillus massiliensis]
MSISFIRTLFLYICVIVALRIMGKRQIGELEPSELVITILVSELAAIPMQDLGVPLMSGVIPIVTLISLEIVVSFLSLKSIRLRRLLNGRPAIIIRSGVLDRRKMQQMRITVDEVLEALRENNIDSISDVKYGVIEPSGKLSYVLQTPYRPTTAEMLNLSPQDSGLPYIVISDGHIIHQNLQKLNKTVEDIEQMVKKAKINAPKDVFLMTLDDCGNQFIQAKEGRA